MVSCERTAEEDSFEWSYHDFIHRLKSWNYRQNKYHVKILMKRFYLNGHTIGFHQQTQKLELCTKQIVPCATTAKEASFEWSNHRISSTVRLKSYKNITSRHA